ncbi:TPA: mercury resistance system periplasmic binding protein MerP [Legionella pneumophila]
MRRVNAFLMGVLIFVLGNIQISFAQAEKSNLQTVILSVPTMNCPVCPITVKKALEKVPGVKQVEVAFKTKTAVVSYDKEKTTTNDLLKATEEVGYKSSVED